MRDIVYALKQKKKKGEGDIETKNNELSLSSLSTVHIYLIESIG